MPHVPLVLRDMGAGASDLGHPPDAVISPANDGHQRHWSLLSSFVRWLSLMWFEETAEVIWF